MMDKKLTRKQFLLTALSVVGLFVVSKVPNIVRELTPKKDGDVYGNYSYGGGNKNA